MSDRQRDEDLIRRGREMQQTAPCFSQTAITKDSELDDDLTAEDRPYRWMITPHPYDGSFDTFVTDDDNLAREALVALWDSSADNPKFSCEFDAAVAPTQQSSGASHNPELSQDSPASQSESALDAAREIIQTVRDYNETSGSSVRVPLPQVLAIIISKHLPQSTTSKGTTE